MGTVREAITSEPQLVELTDGTLLLDARQSELVASPTRTQFLSADGGVTGSAPQPGLEVTEVMASILRYSAVRDGDDLDRILFSAPSATGRFGLRVLVSYDEGQTWTHETLINAGFSAYSSLTVLDDGTIGLLYEPQLSQHALRPIQPRVPRRTRARAGRRRAQRCDVRRAARTASGRAEAAVMRPTRSANA